MSTLILSWTQPAFALHKPIVTSLYQVYQNHRLTFFCEQPFSSKGEVLIRSCDTCAPTWSTIQWIPIVPFPVLAQDLPCYREKICINRHGQRFKGLRCCETDPLYQKMRADLYNFVPEIASLKQQRKHYTFAEITTKAFTTSKGCHFYVDKKMKIVEPAPHLRGMIARTYLYMQETYHFPLDLKERNRFLTWSQQYPPTAWEEERKARIQASLLSQKVIYDD